VAKRTITIGKHEVAPGSRLKIDLPVADLYTQAELTIPIHVINGRRDGPTLFLTAAVHGDELNGVEIIRRVLGMRSLSRLRGCLIAAPIVNVFGFIYRSRYLPDRRDLNRSFPGRETGSVASRLAHLVTSEIISQADFGIDLHTGSADRSNLPQIRGDLSNPEVLRLAKIFGSPVIIDSTIRDGSLRETASDHNIPLLLYEAGEASRFDELSIRAGVRGVTRIMRSLGMLPALKQKRPPIEPVVSNTTSWMRAPCSGIVLSKCKLGQRVKKGAVLATISDPFGEVQVDVLATVGGLVIGCSMLPLAHEGEALYHLARFEDNEEAEAVVEEFQQSQMNDGVDSL
jgi:predicted deacylase